MKPLRIDLGLPRKGVDRALRLGVVGMVAAGLALGAYALFETRRAAARLADVAPPGARAAAEPVETVLPYADNAARWVRVASMPIGMVLAQVETVQVTNVRVNRIEIDAQARTAAIELEASDHGAAVAWFSAVDRTEGGCDWKLQQSRQQGTSVIATGVAAC
jgi:hypothetical protein